MPFPSCVKAGKHVEYVLIAFLRLTQSGTSERAGVCAMSDIIAESLKNGEKVQIVGFGAFEVKERPARKARNPKTGEEIQIGARRSPMFKPGKALKEAVEG